MLVCVPVSGVCVRVCVCVLLLPMWASARAMPTSRLCRGGRLKLREREREGGGEKHPDHVKDIYRSRSGRAANLFGGMPPHGGTQV